MDNHKHTYTQVQQMRKTAIFGYQDGISQGFQQGYRQGYDDRRYQIGGGALIGAPIGTIIGAGTGSLITRPDMSPAKKLAIILASAGIGGAAGAGIGGTVIGSLNHLKA